MRAGGAAVGLSVTFAERPATARLPASASAAAQRALEGFDPQALSTRVNADPEFGIAAREWDGLVQLGIDDHHYRRLGPQRTRNRGRSGEFHRGLRRQDRRSAGCLASRLRRLRSPDRRRRRRPPLALPGGHSAARSARSRDAGGAGSGAPGRRGRPGVRLDSRSLCLRTDPRHPVPGVFRGSRSGHADGAAAHGRLRQPAVAASSGGPRATATFPDDRLRPAVPMGGRSRRPRPAGGAPSIGWTRSTPPTSGPGCT